MSTVLSRQSKDICTPDPQKYAQGAFYKRNHATTETVTGNVTALRKLEEDCGFSNKLLPLNGIMRDRFFYGISNGTVQLRLLAAHELSFETANDLAATAEATAQQHKDIGKQRHKETAAETMLEVTREEKTLRAQDQQCYRCADKHNYHN